MMKLDRLENYFDEDKHIYSPKTPTELLRGVIPGQVIDYCAKYRHHQLSSIHYVFKNLFRGLTHHDKEHVEICEEMIGGMHLDRKSFDRVFATISTLLGEEYIKNDFFDECQEPPVRDW